MQLTIKQAATRWGVDYITARAMLLILEKQKAVSKSKIKTPGRRGRALHVYDIPDVVTVTLDGRQTF